MRLPYDARVSTVTYVGVMADGGGRVVVDAHGRPPTFEVPSEQAGFWQDVGRANKRFSSMLGVAVTVLRHLFIERTSAGSARVILLEPHGPVTGRWMPASGVAWPCSQPVAPLLERTDAIPGEHRVPWFDPGWYDEAAAWIGHVVAAEGVDLLGLEQVRSWNLSTVLAVDTGGGRWFFKAESPALPGEVRLTRGLAELFPAVVPQPIAWDDARRWMLLTDAGSRRLDDSGDLSTWARAGRTFARLQIESVEHHPRLAELAFPVRTAASLANEVAAMVADERWLTVGEYGLDRSSLESTRRLAASWIEALAHLEALDLPMAVEHGDFHPGQVMIGDDGDPRVLDWSDVGVSIPFISLEMFLASVNDFLGLPASAEPPTAAAAFRDAYVETCEQALAPDLVDRARALLRAALPALYGLPYWRLVQRMEQPWEMWNVLPYTMRSALSDQST